MEEEELRQPNLRRMSVLEKNRAALGYLKMKEKPDDFILHNRYLDRTVEKNLDDLNDTHTTMTRNNKLQTSQNSFGDRTGRKEAALRKKAASLLSRAKIRKS